MRRRVPTTTMRIPIALRQQVKIVAAEESTSIQAWVADAIQAKLQQFQDKKAKTVGMARERAVEFVGV